MSVATTKTRIVSLSLAPKAGFCIKSTTLEAGSIALAGADSEARLDAPLLTSNVSNIFDVTTGAASGTPVPKGAKVFVNITWDANVPPPPAGNEDAIQRAMKGEVLEDQDTLDPDRWIVPLVLSNAREDMDKAGKPSIVVDCVYNPSVKSRTLRDPEFKIFLIELALLQFETRYGLKLSRSIGTPNIASKGQLGPRVERVPAALLDMGGSGSNQLNPKLKAKASEVMHDREEVASIVSPGVSADVGARSTPLIQEVETRESGTGGSTKRTGEALPGLRGILKSKGASSGENRDHNGNGRQVKIDATLPLEWSWERDASVEVGEGRLLVKVNVPGLTLHLIGASTLDVEPRRIVLDIPPFPTLDIDVGEEISDAEVAVRVGKVYAGASASADANREKKQEATTRLLKLKRERAFDVDGARAEWALGSGEVRIWL